MSIFGSEGDVGFGSLGMGAPDTGRGDAFDQQARQRGYGLSPSAGTEIELHAPRPQRIPPGAIVGGIEFGTPKPQRIPAGKVVGGIEFGTPKQGRKGRGGIFGNGGLGAAVTASPTALLGQIQLVNGFSVPVKAYVVDSAGRVAASRTIPPRNRVVVSVQPGAYSVRYTATFREGGSRGTVLSVRSGRTISRTLSSY